MRRFVGTLASILVLATVACDSPAPAYGPPAMFRGDAAHSGVLATMGVDERPGLLWRFETGGAVWSSPVVWGGTVYVGSSAGSLHALDARTGEPRWSAEVGSPVSSTAAVAEGTAVFASRDGIVHAVDAATGEPRWRFATGPTMEWEWGFEGWDVYVSSPVVLDAVVVVGAGDGVLYALDLATGAELWRFATEGRIRSTPAIADNTVYVGSSDGRAYALSLSEGALQWQFQTDGASAVSEDMGVDRKSIIASPLVANGSVYVGSRDGFMYALDQDTGAERWRVGHEGSWAMSSPTVAAEALFAGTSDGSFVHRVDVVTGEEIWRFVGAGYTWSSPALVDGAVYIGDGGGYLRALDAESGAERWHYPVTGGVYSSPWVEDGVVYFGSTDGSIYAVGGGAPPVYRAVFWDEELAPLSFVPDLEPRVYFAQRGYDVVDSEGLASFLQARLDDGAQSVVVFAVDRVPGAIGTEASDTVLLRRYLDDGGKVVWMGLPPLSLSQNDEGQVYFDRSGPQSLLGVDYEEVNFDYYGAQPTELGRSWGLQRGWVSTLALATSHDFDVLALDENGRAAAWVKRYGGPEGSGFVGMGLHLVTPETLAGVHAVAEYGIGSSPPSDD